MSNAKGGHKGALWLAPAAGDALVNVTGLRDANYEPGQAFADGHGMDANHGFKVPVQSNPQITTGRVWNKSQNAIWQAIRNTEAGVPSVMVFYPIGGTSDDDALDHGVAGTCWIQGNSAQSLTDVISNGITILPAEGDWAAFGGWDPA